MQELSGAGLNSIESITLEIAGGNERVMRNFVPKVQAEMIKNYFIQRGYLVPMTETGSKSNETYHMEVIKLKGRLSEGNPEVPSHA